jgi:hypothetical protein
MARYDADAERAALIERLAEKDPTFRVNYTATVHNEKFRQLIPTVTAWQIRSALARERRQANLNCGAQEHRQRAYAPSRNVAAVEKELFS